MARLWLLTDAYPFGDGESFIAAELPYVCEHGIEIHLVPTGRGALHKAGGVRPVPKGVVVRTDLASALARARGRAGLARLHHLASMRRQLTRSSFWTARAELGRALRGGPKIAGHNVRRLLDAWAHAAMLADVLKAADDGPAPGDGAYAYWLGASALGMAWALSGRKLVARAHGHDLFAERHVGRYLPLQPAIVAQLSALYCISEDAGRYARARFATHQKMIEVMPLGVTTTHLRAKPSTDGVLRVMSCAFVSPVKDLDLWIDALALVKVPVAWTHLGEGADKARLMRRCAALPEHVRVHWAGAIPPHQVRACLTAEPVDAFVNTSRAEGRAVSIMEALSVGLGVRATDVGGTRELLPAPWLCDRRDGALGIARSIEACAAMSAPARAAEAALALKLWQTKANAPLQYGAFARHLLSATGLWPPPQAAG